MCACWDDAILKIILSFIECNFVLCCSILLMIAFRIYNCILLIGA